MFGVIKEKKCKEYLTQIEDTYKERVNNLTLYIEELKGSIKKLKSVIDDCRSLENSKRFKIELQNDKLKDINSKLKKENEYLKKSINRIYNRFENIAYTSYLIIDKKEQL